MSLCGWSMSWRGGYNWYAPFPWVSCLLCFIIITSIYVFFNGTAAGGLFHFWITWHSLLSRCLFKCGRPTTTNKWYKFTAQVAFEKVFAKAGIPPDLIVNFASIRWDFDLMDASVGTRLRMRHVDERVVSLLSSEKFLNVLFSDLWASIYIIHVTTISNTAYSVVLYTQGLGQCINLRLTYPTYWSTPRRAKTEW